MRTIRWGIIGVGDVVERKSGPALMTAAGSAVVAVMRRDAAAARAFAARHGIARWYDRVDDLLADPDVDAVYVATPTSSHCALTLRALATGRPVLVEKPIAMHTAEAECMIDAAERAGQPLFVAYYRRALPRFERLREIVQSGRLGAIRCIAVHQTRPLAHRPNAGWKLDPTINGGGLFVDVHTHTLDWLDHVFGPPTVAQGLVRRLGPGPAEDLVAFNLGWADGIVASGLYCYGAAPEEEQVTVYGSEGAASMVFFKPAPIRLTDARGRVEEIEVVDPPHSHLPLVERIVAQLRGGPPAPAQGSDGLRTTALIDRLYADYRATA